MPIFFYLNFKFFLFIVEQQAVGALEAATMREEEMKGVTIGEMTGVTIGETIGAMIEEMIDAIGMIETKE